MTYSYIFQGFELKPYAHHNTVLCCRQVEYSVQTLAKHEVRQVRNEIQNRVQVNDVLRIGIKSLQIEVREHRHQSRMCKS